MTLRDVAQLAGVSPASVSRYLNGGPLSQGKRAAIRADTAVFDADADVWTMDPLNDHVLAIGRNYKGEKLLALFNFSPMEQTAWLSEPEKYKDLLTGKKRDAHKIQLPGNGFAWLYAHTD